MTEEQQDTVVAALVAFVERAATGKATGEEVRVLPSVASVLLAFQKTGS